jgi:hypothetical protein
MAIDTQQQRQFGGGMNFDHMSYSGAPHFTNPWVPSSGPPPSHHLYPSTNGMNTHLGLDTLAKQQASRINTNNVSMSSYNGGPVTTASAGSSPFGSAFTREESLTSSQDLLNPPRMQNTHTAYGSGISYTSAPAPSQTTYATSMPYDTMGYVPAPIRSTYPTQQYPQSDSSRRLSQSLVSNPVGLDVVLFETLC